MTIIAELVAAEFEVEINGLEANVTVLERCMARSRSADSYNIHYCIVDSDSKCKKDESKKSIQPYGQSYALAAVIFILLLPLIFIDVC